MTEFHSVVHINVLNKKHLNVFSKGREARTHKRSATPHLNKKASVQFSQKNTQRRFPFLLLNFSLHIGEERERAKRQQHTFEFLLSGRALISAESGVTNKTKRV